MWWLKQSVLYFIGLLWMKLVVFVMIHMFPIIVKIGDWALRWTEGNTALQIIFVMLLFPTIMNAIQYYIVDTFIKKKLSPDHEADLNEESRVDPMLGDSAPQRSAFLATMSDDQDSDLDDDLDGKPMRISAPTSQPAALGRESVEYDPDVDGSDSFAESSESTYPLGARNERADHT